nr:HAMP domain-containing protein [Anaerolineae bacterium]
MPMHDDRLRRSLEDLFSDMSLPEPEGEAEPLIPPPLPAEGIPPVQAEHPERGRAEEREEREISETPRTILAARVTNIRARLTGSLLIILSLLLLTGILYSIALSRLDRAIAALEEGMRANALTAEQQAAASAEVEAARDAVEVVPMVWGLLIAIAVVGTVFDAVRSIARPVEQLTEAVVHLAAGRLKERIRFERADEFGRLGAAFNEMADRLQASYAELEQRVAQRTRELQKANWQLQRRAIQLRASAKIGRAATTILDIDELLRATVNLIRDEFGFYHAGVFLLDEAGEWAELRAASGEAGQKLLAQGHRLAVGETSMVGWTAAHRQPRIALDVGKDAVHFDNPLLPHTRSEMTLPLLVGERLLGVLDVQSTEEAAFDEDDVRALQNMADQIAVAIDNARKFSDEALLLEATSPIYRTSRSLAQATTI